MATNLMMPLLRCNALTCGFVVGRPGLEPGTLGLKVPCSSPMS